MFRQLLILSMSLCPVSYSVFAQPLSDAEADTIIAAQAQARVDRLQARMAELEQAEVMSEGRGVLPNGLEVIVREVRPPAVEPIQPKVAPVTQESTPTPEQIAAWQARVEKQSQTIMLSATVYDHEVTRLSWNYKSEKFVAYANADFNYLSGIHTVETDTHQFTFFMSIGDASRARNPYPNETIPLVSTFSTEHSGYILTQGDPSNQAALSSIVAALKHYDNNLEDLKIAHQRRETLAAAKKRYDATHPKEPEPFIMQFWVPEPTNGKAGDD